MKKKWIFLAPLMVLAFLLFIVLGGLFVQLLWNWLLPPLFGWREITFWQALGLLALCRILFGGWGGRGGYRSSMRRRMADRMAERWDTMTPEERERLRERMLSRCGFSPSAAPGAGRQQ